MTNEQIIYCLISRERPIKVSQNVAVKDLRKKTFLEILK